MKKEHPTLGLYDATLKTWSQRKAETGDRRPVRIGQQDIRHVRVSVAGGAITSTVGYNF